MGDFTSVFDEAGLSAEAAVADKAMALAKQASADISTYFLMGAASEAEFDHRVALAQDELVKAAAVGGISVDALIAERTREFGLLMEARKTAAMPALPDRAEESGWYGNTYPSHYPATDPDHEPDERTISERDDWAESEKDPGDQQDDWYKGDYTASVKFNQHLASIKTALQEGFDPLEWIEDQPEAQGQGQPERPSAAGEAVWQQGYEGAENENQQATAAFQPPMDIPDSNGMIQFHKPDNVHPHHSADTGEVHILDSQRSSNGKHQVMVIDDGGNSQWPVRYDDNTLGFDNPHAVVTPRHIIHRALDHAEYLDKTRGTKQPFSQAAEDAAWNKGAAKVATRPF